MMTVIVTVCMQPSRFRSRRSRRRSCACKRKVENKCCGWPGIQTNDGVCLLGQGVYQRRQRSQRRDNAASRESLVVLQEL